MNNNKNTVNSNSRSGKSKRSNNKAKRFEGNDSRGFKSRENDASWYSQNERLLKDVASIPTADAVGVPYVVNNQNATKTVKLTAGVMTINWFPSIGNTTLSQPSVDAVNVAATALFGYITHANSRNTTYDKSDLMLYMLSVASAYSYFATLRRVYGKLTGFSALDKNTPRLLVQAMGVDYDDLLRNSTQLRTYINVMAQRLGQLAMPAGMSMLDRQIWMNESIFTDTDTNKPQYYMYVQAAYYKYDEYNGRGRCVLVSPRNGNTLMGEWSSTYGEYAPANKAGLKVSELMDFGDELMNVLIGSSDINKMSADIIKAMGGNLFKVSQINEDFTVEPTYSAEVLSQFENAYWAHPCGMYYPLRVSGGISQNGDLGDSVIRNEVALAIPVSADASEAFAQAVTSALPIDAVLNFHKDEVTPSDAMVATRMVNKKLAPYAAPADAHFNHAPDATLAGYKPSDGFRYYMYEAHGTEVILSAYAFFNHTNALGFSAHELGSTMPLADNGDTTTVNLSLVLNMVDRLNIASQFDWAPSMEVAYVANSKAETAQNISVTVPSWTQLELQNYTVLDYKALKQMHDVATLSELSFRGIGDYTLR